MSVQEILQIVTQRHNVITQKVVLCANAMKDTGEVDKSVKVNWIGKPFFFQKNEQKFVLLC